jgi:hypothetical protein
VVSSVCLAIGAEAIALTIDLPCYLQIVFDVVVKVVFIDKVLACVVRWVDVDHLDFFVIGLLEELEDF